MEKIGVAIIGTGFAGLGLAIRLRQTGSEDFVLFERANEVGGTCRENSYPGCACDVESPLYSFSFAPNPGWSRMYSPQPEIFEYLKDCTKKFDLYPQIRFQHSVQNIKWNAEKKLWHIDTANGEFWAKVVVAAAGPLSEPVTPQIEGLSQFKGTVMHSANWNHSFNFKNKRVAVIGTGASAIQIIPELQKIVGELKIFQRTPPWVLPRMDRTFSSIEKLLFQRSPRLQKLLRARIYATRELFGRAFRSPRALSALELLARLHLKKSIKDTGLRSTLTPNYRIGCKRILISDNYYPALTQKNVKIHNTQILRITEHGIAAPNEIAVDAIVFATGFAASEVPFAKHVFGRRGISLSEHWKGSPHAYLGLATPGFPNFFMLLGPNSGLGHNSVVLMIEAQIEHILRTLANVTRQGKATIEVKAEAEEKFLQLVDKKMEDSVWTAGGCKSWYLDRTGRNSTLWPISVASFVKQTKNNDTENWI